MIRAAFATALVLSPALALADGDASKGEIVFKKCAACHALDKPVNKIGPHLIGIIGRKMASVSDFSAYSIALKTKGAAGAVWDEASLSAWIAAPKTFIPGSKMSFTGLKKPEDVQNLLAYIKGKQAK